MPAQSDVYKWLIETPKFSEMYARARETRADSRADRIDEIVGMVVSGELDPNAARVAIDAEKWLAGKEQPKRYGDKIDHTVDAAVTHTVTYLQPEDRNI